MKKRLKNNGISLISLVVAVSIMIIISGLLIYNAKTGIKVRNFNMMKNDIDLLDDKVNSYYVKYAALPISIKYNVSPLPFESAINPNDSVDGYYVLDLSVFEGLTLNYGSDYNRVTEANVADYNKINDLYVINEQSHQIYYARGIELDGVKYYTNDTSEEVSLVQGKKWKKIVEFYRDTMLGLDNSGNLYTLHETYNGTIINNTNYNIIFLQNLEIVSAGDYHTVAIDDQGKVYVWGEGLLGNGTDGENSNVPICLSDLSGNILNGKKVVEISAGSLHTVAIDDQGKVYVWGGGLLGNGTDGENSNVPICLSDLSGNILNGKNIVKIFARGKNTVAIDDQGRVYTWGDNQYGQLGDGTTINSNIPICISDLSGNILNEKKVVEISTGVFHTVALDDQGKVYVWGSGLLGNGTDGAIGNVPICISDISGNILNGKKVVEISAGLYYTVAIDDQGKVYTWGGNFAGQLGSGTNEEYSNIPICISDISGNILNGKKVVKISAGVYHTVAIDNQGKVYTWGDNSEGQLGNGTNEEYSNIPIYISDLSGNLLNGKKVVEISAGFSHTVVIDDQGKVYVWGNNKYGQLGNGTNEDSNVPINITTIMGRIVDISSALRKVLDEVHIVILDDQGKVYTWGDNEYGQLGDGTYEDSNIPICISDLSGNILNGRKVVEISAGSFRTVALDDQGKVYTWGNNEFGRLGDGTTINSNIPICISDLSGNILNGKKVVKISAGASHTVAIDNQGKVYTWGDNEFGQLGDGTTINSNIPICISDLSGNILNGKKIVEISAGFSYTVAIDDQGKVYTWGYNESGQLGSGTNEEYSNIPICISDLSGNLLNGKKVVEISTGESRIVAIDNQGKVYTWGNYNNIPICISEITESLLDGKYIVEIFAGSFHIAAIDNTGYVVILGKWYNDH